MRVSFHHSLRAVPACLLMLVSRLYAHEPGPGGILVEDNDLASVHYTFQPSHDEAAPELGVSGGTYTHFGVFDATGTGLRMVTVSPDLPAAGLYEVWVRWYTLLIAHKFPGF